MSLENIFGLDGKVGFVTGAGSGLGAEMAEALAVAGADVVLAGRSIPNLEVVAQRIRDLGRKALVCQLDVTQEDKIEEVVQTIVTHFGRIDILINNSGVCESPTLLHEMSTEQWRNVLTVDLDGVFYMSRAVLKVMLKQGSGKIINLGSMWSVGGSAGMFPAPAYCAAKGGVANLTRELGLQYAKNNIQINALCPGTHLTEMVKIAASDEQVKKAMYSYTPMGRLAEASEIRGPAIFLASSASNFMTGQTLIVDGGCSAGPGTHGN